MIRDREARLVVSQNIGTPRPLKCYCHGKLCSQFSLRELQPDCILRNETGLSCNYDSYEQLDLSNTEIRQNEKSARHANLQRNTNFLRSTKPLRHPQATVSARN
jgi:hypothetical protein